MIVSIGEASMASDKPSSKALFTAWKLAQMGYSSMYAGPIAGDEEGMKILEFLIDNCVFFDPVFCKEEKFSKEKLESIFDLNDDIDVVVLSGECLKDKAIINTLYEVLSTKKGAKIYLNATDNPQLAESELAGICCKVRTKADEDEEYDARVVAGLQNGAKEV